MAKYFTTFIILNFNNNLKTQIINVSDQSNITEYT
jgi:hypothetical protein